MGKDNVPQGSVSGWDWFPTVFLCLFGLIWFVVGRKILLPTVLNLWTWTHSKVALGLSLTGSSAVDSPQPLPTTPSKPNPCQRCVRATMEHRAKPREYQKAFPEQGVKPRFLEETPWHFSHEHRMESWDGHLFFSAMNAKLSSWAGRGEPRTPQHRGRCSHFCLFVLKKKTSREKPPKSKPCRSYSLNIVSALQQ